MHADFSPRLVRKAIPCLCGGWSPEPAWPHCDPPASCTAAAFGSNPASWCPKPLSPSFPMIAPHHIWSGALSRYLGFGLCLQGAGRHLTVQGLYRLEPSLTSHTTLVGHLLGCHRRNSVLHPRPQAGVAPVAVRKLEQEKPVCLSVLQGPCSHLLFLLHWMSLIFGWR